MKFITLDDLRDYSNDELDRLVFSAQDVEVDTSDSSTQCPQMSPYQLETVISIFKQSHRPIPVEFLLGCLADPRGPTKVAAITHSYLADSKSSALIGAIGVAVEELSKSGQHLPLAFAVEKLIENSWNQK